MRIAFVPLDDRPCTWRFPQQLAALIGWELREPAAALIGSFTRAGHPLDLITWLAEAQTDCDASLLSIDMLLFGGLVASRSPHPFPRQALDALRKTVTAGPPAWASSVLMRVAPTTTSEPEAKLSARVLQYSGLATAGRSTTAVEKEFPPGYLDMYLASRRRNHEVNYEMLRWAAESRFRFLLLGIDDSKTAGLNVVERRRLEPLLSERSAIAPGTDELAHILLARMTDSAPRFHVTWSSQAGRKQTPLYEDRSYEALLEAQVAATGGSLVADPGEADIRLFVHVLAGGQREAAEQFPSPRISRDVDRFLKSMEQAVSDNSVVALADLAFANGADQGLMSRLKKRIPLLSLDAFSAWNTAGNALGTALAHATMRFVWKSKMRPLASPAEVEAREKAHVAFLLNRLLDDWIYQAVVRQQTRLALIPLGVSPYNLGDRWTAIQAQVDRRMGEEAHLLFDEAFRNRRHGDVVVEAPFTVRTTLPWPRIFEVDVDCSVNVRLASSS